MDVYTPSIGKNRLATQCKYLLNLYCNRFLTSKDIQTGKSIVWSIGEDHRR